MVTTVSTRAIIAYATDDGRWKGVLCYWSGHTQHLGKTLIRRVSKAKGDLATFVADAVDNCPEGWSEFDKKRSEDSAGVFGGAFDGVVATADPTVNELVFDAMYLYLFVLPKRRLYVFEIKEGPMRPFGMVTFDEAGAAKPKSFPAVEE